MADKTEELGTRIARLRGEMELTQSELAWEVRALTGRSVVAAWENGAQPAAKWVMPLAKALKVSAEYLLTGEVDDD